MTPGTYSEIGLVEQPVIQLFSEFGWETVPELAVPGLESCIGSAMIIDDLLTSPEGKTLEFKRAFGLAAS